MFATQQIEFNINDEATVTLNEFGLKVYNDRIQRILDAFPNASIKLATDPRQRMPLWELMKVFGPVLYHGMPQTPFVGNVVTIEARD